MFQTVPVSIIRRFSL